MLYVSIVKICNKVCNHSVVSLVHSLVCVHAICLAKSHVRVARGVAVGVGVDCNICIVHCFIGGGFVDQVCGITCVLVNYGLANHNIVRM